MGFLKQFGGRDQLGASASSGERLIRAGWLQLVVFIGGTLGYYVLTEEQSLLNCAYMTVITITTVGYDETIPVAHDPVLQIYTIFLLIIGMGAVLYFVSVLAAFMIEGDLRDVFRRRKMDRQIAGFKDHFIIAGLGRTGRNIAAEVLRGDADCVLIDTSQECITEFLALIGKDAPFVVGDATDDDVLGAAGIDRSKGLALCLGDDRENLFATISAHRLNRRARIITRGDDPRSEAKFLMAGASSVVYINSLGGRHMAAELIRPQITNFLSLLFEHPELDHDIDKISVPPTSPLVGKTLADVNLRQKTDALIIAFVDQAGKNHFNPNSKTVIEADYELIILARPSEFKALKQFIQSGRWPV
ncbi:MAG: potassium channel family protein [Bradymonadaceae bacterium]